MNFNFTIFATRISDTTISIGIINADNTNNIFHIPSKNIYDYFIKFFHNLNEVFSSTDNIRILFKGDDSLSYQMLDAFAEVNQKNKCEYTFHDPSKSLFYRMCNIELIIFGFNYQGYIDNIVEDYNESSPLFY